MMGSASFHKHPSFCEIYYQGKGSTCYDLQEHGYASTDGDIIYLPSGVPHRVRIDGPSLCRIWVGIDQTVLDRILSLFEDLRCTGFPDWTSPFILKASKITKTDLLETFHRLGNLRESELFGWEMRVRGAAADLVVELGREYYSQSTSPTEKRQDLLERICHYIDRHLGEPIDRDVICKRFYISPSTLSHLFRTELEVSFSQYLLRRRMERAASLLQAGELPLQDICRLCGYSEYSSFFRAFRSHYGCSPRDWAGKASGQFLEQP